MSDAKGTPDAPAAPVPVGFLEPTGARARRTWSAIRDQRWDDARRHLDETAEFWDDDSVWHQYLRGLYDAHRHDFDASRRALEAVLSCPDVGAGGDRMRAMVWERLGLLYRRREELDRSADAHQTAYDLRTAVGSPEEQWESAQSCGVTSVLRQRRDAVDTWFSRALAGAARIVDSREADRCRAMTCSAMTDHLIDVADNERAVSAARDAVAYWKRFDVGAVTAVRAEVQLGRALVRHAESLLDTTPESARAALDEAIAQLTEAKEALLAFGPETGADTHWCGDLLDFAKRLRGALQPPEYALVARLTRIGYTPERNHQRLEHPFVSFSDLQSFVAELESRQQLKRITAPVDPILEASAITDRVSKSPAPGASPPPTDPVHGRRGGHALLFDNPVGSDIPLATNLFGSYERMRIALGVDSFEALADRVQQLIKPEMPTSLLDKMKKLPQLAKLASFGPKVVKHGLCQEVVHIDDADLFSLPVIQCWPRDGEAGYGLKPADCQAGTGRYITLAGIYTKDRHTGERNVGMYRVQLFEPKLAAMHWHMHHDGARHFRQYRSAKEKMPLAIVLGGEPVLPYAATCPLPPDVSELLFAGFLNNGGIDLVPCKTVPLEVPCHAEIVIEGWVDPAQMLVEGPFGDHTGFYSLADKYPSFHVSCITHRRNPLYPATIVGKPPQEDYYLGKATERILLPALRMLIPDIIDYSLPIFGAFHNCVFVKIHKEYPMQARKVISSIWGAGQMMFTKMIVVVDDHVNVHDEQDVLFHMGANVDWRRDTIIADGPCDVLDHATPYYGTGAKIGIDATRKIAGEGIVRDWPDELEMSPDIVTRVQQRWTELGLS